MTIQGFPGVRFSNNDTTSLLRQMATLFNNLLRGKLNVAVEFIPAALDTSTTVTDSRIGPDSILIIEPTSSAGAVEIAAGTMFIDAADRGVEQCTVTHSTGAASELFRLVILS
ncbi:hypothetical protein N9980_01280 [bacterium]|nr:hypothetical protein [bacterium]